MSTVIYPSPIFGPIKSRRLGVSLGINLLPGDGKVCTFDCVYCECGFNAERRPKSKLPTRQEVAEALEAKLQQMQAEGMIPDVLTFAGNGEPTIHPEFEGIIDDTIALRDKFAPQAKVSVLSNATQLHREDVCRALHKIDNPILKLDSAIEETAQLINKPCGNYSVARVIEQLAAFGKEFVLQTMFLRGDYNGTYIDNTTENEFLAWAAVVDYLRPRQVMVYSIDRATPCKTIEKVPREELEKIAERVRALGIECSAV